MDDKPGGRERDHAVRHVEKERRELVALVFDLGERVPQDLRHIVEVSGQNADLITARDLQTLREIARGDLTRADGQRADGCDEDLRQQEREHQTDHKAERQRLKDDVQHLPGQLVHSRLAVADVDDIAAAVGLDRHGKVHISAGDGAVLPDLAVHGGEDVRGDVHARLLIGGCEHIAGGGEDVDVSARNVDAEAGLRHEKLLHLARRVLRLLRQTLKLGDEVLREGLLHLDIELGDIEVADAVDQKRADDGHERQNQDDEDHDQLHTKRAHTARPLSG